jgi:hypothetical protein
LSLSGHLPKYNIGAHFLTAKTFRNTPYFRQPQPAGIVCEELEAARSHYGFEVLAFVMMPDHLYLTAAKLGEKVVYIHRNPVRAGLVPTATDYPWSSFRNYAGQPARHPVRITNYMEIV